jgi:hypothetical protein
MNKRKRNKDFPAYRRGLLTLIVAAFLCGCPMPPEVPEKVLIADSANLDKEWTVLSNEKLFRPGKKRQNVCFLFAEPQEVDHQKGRLLSRIGQDYKIEAQVIDSNDNVLDLNKISYLNETKLCFYRTPEEGWQDILPRDRLYKGVRIRSNHPILIKEIAWEAYDSKITK